MLKRSRIILILISALLIIAVPVSQAQEFFPRYRVVGYYTSYSIFNEPPYYLTDVPTRLLTHLIYAHIGISENGQCESVDEYTDTQFPYPNDTDLDQRRGSAGNFNQLALIKENNPELRIMMSIGGWENSRRFTDVAATPESRVRFVESCMVFMREYGFDGIDIDWRFPVAGGIANGSPADRDNYPLLMADFRGQLAYWEEQDNNLYSLSMTAPATPELYQHYDLSRIVPYVDFINMQAYSFEGTWSTLAAHHAPLYNSSRDPRDDETSSVYSVNGAVSAFLDQGVPASKIVIGVPFFGQTWSNVEPNDFFGLFSPAGGIPTGTRGGGQLYYRDLTNFLSSPNYTRFFDRDAGVPWMYSEASRIAISYENEESVRTKANYVRANRLGGMMAWELSFDDSAHSLLSSMSAELLGSEIGTE